MNVVQDGSSEVDDIEGLADAATKFLELLKQNDETERIYFMKNSEKCLKTENSRITVFWAIILSLNYVVL